MKGDPMDQKRQPGPAEPDRRAANRRHGDRRGSLRAAAGRRRVDRRRAATAGAGLVMAAVTLLPSLRGAQSAFSRQAAGQEWPAPPRPGTPEEAPEGVATAPFDAFIEEASALYGVSSDLVRAVIQTESGFNPRAVSGVGAKGLMQLMPRTARALGINDPFDPRQNIFGGVKYLGTLLEKYNGNVALALASYNAGPGNVRKHGGIPPFRETRGYVRKITGLLADAAPDTADQASGD